MTDMRPIEKGDACADRANGIPIKEMIGRWLLLDHGAFCQPQPQQPNIKINVALKIASDRRDVMNALCLHFFCLTCPCHLSL